jgi:uncharacterized protein (TIGR03790 family)
MSITSALALGFNPKWCANGCDTTAATDYYGSASRRPYTDYRFRPSMMLGAQTLAQAQALIDRGVAADGSISSGRVSGTGWLVRTSDEARSVRWPDFQALSLMQVPNVTLRYVDNSAGRASDVVARPGQRAAVLHGPGGGAARSPPTAGCQVPRPTTSRATRGCCRGPTARCP